MVRYGFNAWLYNLIFSCKTPNAPYKIPKYYSSYIQIETKPFEYIYLGALRLKLWHYNQIFVRKPILTYI